MKDIKFDLKDIAIIPEIITPIESRRSDVNPYYQNHLPLLAAPMDTVVDTQNIQLYLDNGIIPCLPRGKHLGVTNDNIFKSFGINEILDQIIIYTTLRDEIEYDKDSYFWNNKMILIDIANGHMQKLVNTIKSVKKYFPDIILMVGNIARPETFVKLSEAGADFVRCSIGTGAGCTTAANVAINYPLGSLIHECAQLKKEKDINTKIVADGGMQGVSDIIKCLVLGADYIMMGSTFNKAIESAGDTYLYNFKINKNIASKLWKWGFPVKKLYRGMSTKAVQRSWGKTKLVTAEGITKYQKVEYNLSQWVENFTDYLRSNMSYAGAYELDEYIGGTEWVYITYNALKRFEK